MATPTTIDLNSFRAELEALNNQYSGYGGIGLTPERISQMMSAYSTDPRSVIEAGENGPETNWLYTALNYLNPDEKAQWDSREAQVQNYANTHNQGGFLDSFMLNLPLMLGGAVMGPAMGAMLGGAEAGAMTGGLDGALGDSFANYASGMGGNNILSAGGGGAGFGGGGGGVDIYDEIQNFATSNSGSSDFTNSFNPNASLGQEATTGTNISTNPFSGFSEGGLASSITPASLGGTAGTAATSGTGFMQGLQDIFKGLNKSLIPGTNLTGSNIGAALANYFMQAQKQDQLNAAANKSAQLNDPMQQTARLPFQAAYANLMFNPNSYQSTPYAQGQTNLANQAFQANVSKYGPGGTQFSDYLKNFQNIQSNDFFKLADQFSTAGGFNQGTGGAGNAFGQLAGQAANAGPSAFEGFGRLFQPASGNQATSIPGNFDFSTTYTPQNNPFSTGFSLS